jgi:hypothetical protein
MTPQFEPGMPVSIAIGGKDYPIRFTLRVLKQLQQDHSISVLSANFAETLSDMGKLPVILYYGMRVANPEITLDWIEDNVDLSVLVGMIPALTFAMSGRQVKPTSDASPNAERPKVNGIGSNFGPSDASTSD